MMGYLPITGWSQGELLRPRSNVWKSQTKQCLKYWLVHHDQRKFESLSSVFRMAMDVQWMSQSNGCHKAKGCQRKRMSKQRHVTATFRFWGKSCTKASFIFHFHFLRQVSQESFVFTSATFRFWGTSRTKASFHIFHFHFLRKVSHEMRFGEIADGEACPVDGFETRSFQPGSFPDRPRSGTDSSGVFCSWTSSIVLEWLHQGCDSDLSADFSV